jgi:hypothetical protein
MGRASPFDRKGKETMIDLYGKKYAKNEKEFSETLFQADGTANGFYKVMKAGIYFSDMQGNERAFIRADGLGPVTTHKHEGKRRYMFSTSTRDEQWLGVPDSYSATIDGAKELARQVFAK